MELDTCHEYSRKKYLISNVIIACHMSIQVFITYRSYKRRSEKLNDKYARYLYTRKFEM